LNHDQPSLGVYSKVEDVECQLASATNVNLSGDDGPHLLVELVGEELRNQI